VALVGDAGYCVSPASGQGTTIAMVAAYVLAGELATHKQELLAGISSYEHEIRDYVNGNLDLALSSSSEPQGSIAQPDDVPDFGRMVQPISLKNYKEPNGKNL
jgi:2-polyprenyl-6-methoxyphenol hydroxylase-like FAD-dependent oxidoreductase